MDMSENNRTSLQNSCWTTEACLISVGQWSAIDSPRCKCGTMRMQMHHRASVVSFDQIDGSFYKNSIKELIDRNESSGKK